MIVACEVQRVKAIGRMYYPKEMCYYGWGHDKYNMLKKNVWVDTHKILNVLDAVNFVGYFI